MIHDTQLVRDIAIEHPGATKVFRAHHIDYCCNGDRPLVEAATARGVDLAALRAALEAAVPQAEEAPDDTADLIAHILSRYHAVHLAELPEAIRLARRVEAVHRDHPRCPHGLADFLAIVTDELAGHQRKEEQVLFPMMLDDPGAMIRFPIERMTREHDDVAEQLLHLAVLTTDFTPPEGACTTWRALYRACAKIDADLREHMHLENNVLFRRFL